MNKKKHVHLEVQIRLAVETKEEQDRRMMQPPKTAQVGHGDGERKKRKSGEDGSNHTAHVGPGDRGRKKSKKEGIDLIWISLGLRLEFKKNNFSRNKLARPVMGTIFLGIDYPA